MWDCKYCFKSFLPNCYRVDANLPWDEDNREGEGFD